MVVVIIAVVVVIVYYHKKNLTSERFLRTTVAIAYN